MAYPRVIADDLIPKNLIPIGDEPFIYTFGDDFISATPGRFSQMVAIHDRTGLGVISCIRADRDDDYARYGYVAGKEIEPGIVAD